MSFTSPQNASDQDVDRFYRIGRDVAAHQDRPPAPLHIDAVQADDAMIGVLHWTWRQSGPVAVGIGGGVEESDPEHLLGMLGYQAQAMPNPINSLMAALRAALRDCVQQDVVPVVIHLHTTHSPSSESFVRNDRLKVATVSIAVTVIPQKWVQERADSVSKMIPDRPPDGAGGAR